MQPSQFFCPRRECPSFTGKLKECRWVKMNKCRRESSSLVTIPSSLFRLLKTTFNLPIPLNNIVKNTV